MKSKTIPMTGVTADQFAKLQKAESIGAHLGKRIKPKHKFTKIT